MQAKKLKLFPKKQVLEEYFRNKTTLYFHPRESKIINWFKPVGLAYANLNFGRIFTYYRFIFIKRVLCQIQANLTLRYIFSIEF